MFNVVPCRTDMNFEVRPQSTRFHSDFKIVHTDADTAKTLALADFKNAVERSMYSEAVSPRPRFVPGHVAGQSYLAITALDRTGGNPVGDAVLSIINVSFGGKLAYLTVGFAKIDSVSGDTNFTSPGYAPPRAYVIDPNVNIEILR